MIRSRGFACCGRRLPESFNFPRIGLGPLWKTSIDATSPPSQPMQVFTWKERRQSFNPPHVSRPLEAVLKSNLEELGVHPESWYVCLHVREGGFRKDDGRRDYRNANILRYVKAIQHITDAGGWVVRLGDNSMTPLPVGMKQVIDYPFTKQKSGLMDLYLIQNCRFYIGMLSGPWDIAELFKKDKLGINMYDCSAGFGYGDRDRSICKHVFSYEKDRFLSLKELFASGDDLMNIYGVTSDAYRYEENTEEEIAEAVMNYLRLIEENDDVINELQAEARRYWKRHAWERLMTGNITGNAGARMKRIQEFRMSAKIEMAEVIIDPTYLQKNWDHDSFRP